MIEISHKQAERLIRRQFDLPLSDEEWTALQNHLECCPTCRIYQSRLQSTERKISQSLRIRWDPVTGPSRRFPQTVSMLYRERCDRRSNLITAASSFALFSFIFLLMVVPVPGEGKHESIPQSVETIKSPTPVPSPTKSSNRIPLIQPGQFPHIIAYESQQEGNAEIYLLNPGFSPVNITQHPAEDTFPTWSPDGEWLAFLSNRATSNQKNSKNELYAISIAGNQLVQLTSETLVDWDGPLSWSADGKWIAVAGVFQNESRQRSIYVVGVDGSGPRQLPSTQGGVSPKFAPYGDRLAFLQTEGRLNRIVIYHMNSGLVAFENISPFNLNPAEMVISYDWPADGDGLYYTATLPSSRFTHPTLIPKCSRIVIQQIPNDEAWHQKLRDHFHLVGNEIASAVHSVSWAPKEMVIYSAAFQEQFRGINHCEAKENCSGFPNFSPSQISGSKEVDDYSDLCVQSDLDRGSWSLDMRWFIFTASEQGVEETGLYAIRMPGLNLGRQLSGTHGVQSAAIPVGTVFRLSPDNIKSSPPRMRPFRTRMKIDPHPGKMEMVRKDFIPVTH